ncbi:MAG: dual specificity protein phosphatase family protein [Gammaproteobacteria bacterium]|nr:dual specificity protein phosphatase family protein [Gammaproteobacteria bacterium]
MFFLCHLSRLIDDALIHAPTLVHCHAGIDRSPFAIAVYLVTECGYMPTDAYDLVKEKHPQTIIHDDWMKSFYEAWIELESNTWG